MRLLATMTVLAVTLTSGDAAGAGCAADSGAARVALLELYTSEGCDSCPPADRWVSALAGRGLDPRRVVTLGFHVDYWNYLGWPDPFASPAYSARQRAASQRNRARVVYTPQLLLNGRAYRRATFRDDFAGHVAAINGSPAAARIRLELRPGSQHLQARVSAALVHAAAAADAALYLALYENNLATRVTAGENRGKELRHDYVVRELAGPHRVGSRDALALEHDFRLGPGWKTADLHVAAFVQDEASGDVLQSLALPYCA